MFTHKLNILPEWEKFKVSDIEEGEEWKWKIHLDAARSLYEQWREVFQLVMAFSDTLPEVKDEEEIVLSTKQLIFENAFIIAPKILSASRDTLYEIKMENAALIRFNCRQMMDQIGYAVLMGNADQTHKSVIEEALIEFKLRFRHWVSLFQKDEFEDEWGLFI